MRITRNYLIKTYGLSEVKVTVQHKSGLHGGTFRYYYAIDSNNVCIAEDNCLWRLERALKKYYRSNKK